MQATELADRAVRLTADVVATHVRSSVTDHPIWAIGGWYDAELSVRVDGVDRTVTVDTRTSLLDALRERLGVISPKKGCDYGQCGACTVLAGGRRVLACLTLAVTQDGAEITTAAGLAPDGELHPVAQAFVDCDAFQCGYCTPGQICSAVGMLDEFAHGWPSAVTGAAEPVLDHDEIAERMSGNLCRCGDRDLPQQPDGTAHHHGPVG